MTTSDPVAITRDLVRCPSVTPADAGAIAVLEKILGAAGFRCERVTFSESGTFDIDNLYARIGTGSPHLMFAGHTDVVPVGHEAAWSHPPFSGDISDGLLFGRGAVDMKGGIACSVAAVLDHLAANGGKPKGSISFLITGDEESIAVNGTVKLVKWAAERGEKFDNCILAEPSCRAVLGDTIKIGRRGSLNGTLTVTGRQGHVAYPQRAENPIRGILELVQGLHAEPLDKGSKLFDPSHLEFTSVDVGNKTVNIIPNEARARFNIRFNDNHTTDSLKVLLQQRAEKIAGGRIRFAFQFEPSNADVFVVEPGPFTDLVAGAVKEATGRTAELSTTGGTSDARFIKNYCPVVEFGLVGQTMHSVDEHVPTADLVALTAIYRHILDKYFG
jgi:succinyl-diaminopimelate desuccinylase